MRTGRTSAGALLFAAAVVVAVVGIAAGNGSATPPAWFSLLPPLLSIALALSLRNVIVALFAGIWLGAWGLHGLSLAGLWRGLLAVVDVHVRGALADEDHAAILLFSFLYGCGVGRDLHSFALRR